MHKTTITAVTFFMTFCFTTGFCQTEITGDISRTIFDASGNPFIVKADILVPESKNVVINEGCIFLFTPFTGLNVLGCLQVDGSVEKPVVFTSIKDTTVNGGIDSLPGAFDWNGIYIKSGADSVRMNHLMLRYSVYGIKTQSKDIVIRSSIFNSNGQFHFSINEKLQLVQDNIPYSYPDPEKIRVVQNRKTNGVLISTSPSKAEIYLDKKPGKRVRRNSLTPALIPSEGTDERVKVTLFKKGFIDTTFIVDFARTRKNIDVALSAISPDRVAGQNRFLRDRLHAHLGISCFIATPILLGAGAGFTSYARSQRDVADEKKGFLDNTFLSPDDAYYRKQERAYDKADRLSNLGTGGAIGTFILGAVAAGAGVVLFWYW